MPAAPPEAGFSFSGISVTNASVVSMRAAFCSAVRTTFVGSTTPAFTRSSYLPVATLNPSLPLRFLSSWTIKAPSWPALSASWRVGNSNDSEDIVLAHNQVVFTIDLDLGSAVFGEEDFVACFDIEFDLLAIVVELASADGCDGTFLRLLFRRVGNDDVSLLDFSLFERLNQHAIEERFHIDCHMCSVSSFLDLIV